MNSGVFTGAALVNSKREDSEVPAESDNLETDNRISSAVRASDATDAGSRASTPPNIKPELKNCGRS